MQKPVPITGMNSPYSVLLVTTTPNPDRTNLTDISIQQLLVP